MAELQSLLSRRRSLDEEKTQVFDSAAFRKEGALDDGSVKLGKQDTQQVNAFRSGWTSTPQFGDKEKARCSTGTAQESSFAETEAQSVESRRKLFDMQNRNSAIGNAKWHPQAVVATMQTAEPSLLATPPQNEQRQRLDKLIEFAAGEASKLENLIKEAEINGDAKAVEIGQLLQAKSRAEYILNESRKQREQLVQALSLVEGERDDVRADNAKLEVERDEVKHMVEAAQEEQSNLQQVIANFEREKTRLNSLVTRKEALEKELAQANAAAAELAEKAKQSERLEKILLMGQAEQDRLDKLLSQRTSEHSAVLQQKQVLDVKLGEVVKQNEQLRIQLKNQGNIEQMQCALEEENTRLRVLTAASLAEKQNLERVLEETCQHNTQLQSELNGFVAEESQLGHQVSTLQHECDDLQDKLQVVLSVRQQALADAVKAREETQKLETSRKEHELAERMRLEQAQKLGEQLHSLESEKDLLVQELERTRSQICSAEHRASMAMEQKNELNKQIAFAFDDASRSKQHARALEHEAHQLAVELEQTRCKIESREDHLLQATQEKDNLQERLHHCRCDQFGQPAVDSTLDNHQHYAHIQDTITQRSAGSPCPRAANLEGEGSLTKQLNDVMRQNEQLQRRIDEELPQKQSTAQARSSKSTATVLPPPMAGPAEPTDFGLMIDSWLNALDSAEK